VRERERERERENKERGENKTEYYSAIKKNVIMSFARK
jgi:hypothetical protein